MFVPAQYLRIINIEVTRKLTSVNVSRLYYLPDTWWNSTHRPTSIEKVYILNYYYGTKWSD